MSLRLWICKRLTKSIEKKERQIIEFRIAIDTLRRWIKKDREQLQKRLQQLSDEENLDYGLQCGFIENLDDFRTSNIVGSVDEKELKAIRRKK